MIELLYRAIEEKLWLTDKEKDELVTYQDMPEDKEGAIGIYLYPSSNDLETLYGGVVYESIKAHIQVNSDKSNKSLMETLDKLREFVRRIELEKSAMDGVVFVMCRHTGPKAHSIGKNKYGIPVCVSNIDIKYAFK